jgi:hypothetical protein
MKSGPYPIDSPGPGDYLADMNTATFAAKAKVKAKETS